MSGLGRSQTGWNAAHWGKAAFSMSLSQSQPNFYLGWGQYKQLGQYCIRGKLAPQQKTLRYYTSVSDKPKMLKENHQPNSRNDALFSQNSDWFKRFHRTCNIVCTGNCKHVQILLSLISKQNEKLILFCKKCTNHLLTSYTFCRQLWAWTEKNSSIVQCSTFWIWWMWM